MRKVIAVILAVVLVSTLFACGSSGAGTTSSPAAQQSASPSAASPSASPSPSPSVSASPSPSEENTVGYYTDKVDYFAREQYKFSIMMMTTSTAFVQSINDSFSNWGKVMNYETFVYDANNDYDAYMNQIQVFASQGYDGLACGMDDGMVDRVYELTQEYNIPAVGMLTAFSDKDGHTIWPSVTQDEYANGATCMQWLADNYTNYWKDEVDPEKLGLITVDFSPVISIHARIAGMFDKFAAVFPNSVKNYYTADLVTNSNGFSQQSASEMTAAIISAHPEVTKWFIIGAVDDFAVGAARAVEALHKEKDVLIVSDQADAFFTEMQSGNENSCYVAACAISSVEMAGNAAACLCAIADGRATAETIWPEFVRSGDKYPNLLIRGTMITKDTYQDWQQKSSFEAVSADMKKMG